MLPKTMSIIFPVAYAFATAHPIANPIAAGIPCIIGKGSRASLIRTCIGP